MSTPPPTAGSILDIRGGRPLRGEIAVQGAKNFVPKAMVAALLGSGPSRLTNVPGILDVDIMTGLLQSHGVKVKRSGDEVLMDPAAVALADFADIDAHAGSSRIPILLCGPLLHRIGRARIPELGGCKIGDRPIGYHLDALRAFGATVDKREGGLYLSAESRLHGTKIHLEYPSVGATEQVLLTAVLAEGQTELSGAAVEPEIEELIALLQKMGAEISIHDNRVLRITGVDELSGFTHHAMSDRLEAASWGCAALATGGDVTVRGAQQRPMMTFLNVFRKVGGAFDVTDNGIRFWHPGGSLRSIALETDVHPGFMTDWQQPLVVALTQAEGLSIIHETVYENRLGFTSALNAMGAKIQLYRECLGSVSCRFGQRNYLHSAVISGPTPLRAAELDIPDLRGGFSYLIAALAAEGSSTIRGANIISRGYGDFLDKLTDLGACYDVLA